MKDFCSMVTKRPKVQGSETWGVKCSEVKWCDLKWSDVKWSDDRRWNVLSLIYIYVAVCRFCAVRCLIIICFYLLFSNHSSYVFKHLLCLFSCFVSLFSILCILCFFYCFVYFFPSFVYSCLLPIFAQVYRSLPPGGKPIAVNK